MDFEKLVSSENLFWNLNQTLDKSCENLKAALIYKGFGPNVKDIMRAYVHGAHFWLYLESGTTFGSVSNWFQISLGTWEKKLPRDVNKVIHWILWNLGFQNISFSAQIYIYTAYFTSKDCI